jgi:hypothetical protein
MGVIVCLTIDNIAEAAEIGEGTWGGELASPVLSGCCDGERTVLVDTGWRSTPSGRRYCPACGRSGSGRHSPGQLTFVVDRVVDQVLLISDAVHLYEELDP